MNNNNLSTGFVTYDAPLSKVFHDNTLFGDGTRVSPLRVLSGVNLSASGPTISAGAGTPESVIIAPVGSLFLRSDGGTGTTLYVKETGSGNTGWVAK